MAPNKTKALNLIMVMDVLNLLLEARLAALVRSAGFMGAQAFEENVDKGRVPLCVVDPMEFPDLDRQPFRVPVGTASEAVRIPVQTMIASIAALRIAQDGIDEEAAYYEAFEVEDLVCIHSEDLNVASKLTLATYPRHVTFVSTKPFVGIPANFLSFCTSVEYARFIIAGNPTTEVSPECQENGMVVEASFMSDCSALVYADIGVLKDVVEVRPGFLQNCGNLKGINLIPLTRITRISSSFMAKNMSLTAIDLSPLCNVTIIACEFLLGCMNLATIDLSPFKNVVEIGEKFLGACAGLTEIDLSPLKNVTDIGPWFLACCKGLKVIDLSSFYRIESIPMGLLDEFRGRNVILPTDLCPSAYVAAQAELNLTPQAECQFKSQI